ncbi:hypothetical protein QBC47DRAFT_424105 [Echria macrotheca]|uniref:DUF7580 domain-containing protein n=1 Tax=Echria macrotheca TaxID=438768 RepID=A0AAJ0F7P6_9PEZI|nr:hypothetical protein QBC47DRAFT_424105 [Echria macrotheca]
MSGAEFIIGTVLASIPITLEIYDRSGRVFEIFSIFQQYPREVVIFKTKLDVQRTIFRNNAINLLTTITGNGRVVREVVKQPSSDAARQTLVVSPDFAHHADALDDSFEACRQTVEHIRSCLQLLCFQFDEFQADAKEKQDLMSARDWVKHTRTRFKLGLQKPKISKAIEELRELNRDFVLITEQITRLVQETPNTRRDIPWGRQVSNLNLLQKYHRIRHASTSLYSTLQVQWVCASHRAHLFEVRVLDCEGEGEGKGKEKARTSVARCITCELTITHDGSSHASNGPLRLEIEQSYDSSEEDGTAVRHAKAPSELHRLAAVLDTSASRQKLSGVRRWITGFRKDRQGGRQQPTQQHQQQVRPKGEEPSSALPLVSRSLAGFQDNITFGSNRPPDPPLVEDLCKYLCTAPPSRVLLKSIPAPHAQWFTIPSNPQEAEQPQTAAPITSRSLSDMIRWIAEDPIIRALPRPLLIDLAGNVAEGIMQFYSTPWLASSDLRQNVRYLQPPPRRSQPSSELKGPYFIARMESGGNLAPRATVKSGSSSHTRRNSSDLARPSSTSFAEARNELLFSFGVLLLEIGYGQPWGELKDQIPRATTASHHDVRTAGKEQFGSDYRAAERLAQLLINRTGISYSKVVKKCLACDFGLGEANLDNEDLQRRFLEDVVFALKQLRDDLREMELDEV